MFGLLLYIRTYIHTFANVSTNHDHSCWSTDASPATSAMSLPLLPLELLDAPLPLVLPADHRALPVDVDAAALRAGAAVADDQVLPVQAHLRALAAHVLLADPQHVLARLQLRLTALVDLEHVDGELDPVVDAFPGHDLHLDGCKTTDGHSAVGGGERGNGEGEWGRRMHSQCIYYDTNKKFFYL